MFSFIVKGLTGPFIDALLGAMIMNVESVLVILGYDLEKEDLTHHKKKIFKYTRWIGILFIIGAILEFVMLLYTGVKGLSWFG